MNKTTLTSLRSLLQAAARSLGIERAAYAALIEQMWPEVVGVEAVQASRLVGLRGGTLLVETSTGIWAQELSARRALFADEINRRLGGQIVHEIRFRQGAGPFGRPAAQDAGTPVSAESALTPGELAVVEQALAEIADPELQEAARRAMIAQYKWRKRHAPGHETGK